MRGWENIYRDTTPTSGKATISAANAAHTASMGLPIWEPGQTGLVLGGIVKDESAWLVVKIQFKISCGVTR